MAKKSSKSTRRTRAKKEQVTKKKPTTQKVQAPEEPVIIAEGSDEPVVKAKKPAQKSPVKKKATTEAVAEPGPQATVEEVAEEIVQPTRRAMIVSAVGLAVIVLALIFGAGIMRQQGEQQASQGTPSGQTSASADAILESGGKMCTNEQATNDINGSTNPQSVGMILQTNPSNNIQTPQTYGSGGSDAAALQGASCF